MDELDPFFQMGFAPAKKTSATSSQISSSQISSSQISSSQISSSQISSSQIPLNAMMTPQPMFHNYNNQQPNLYPAGPLSTLRSSPITNNWDFPTYQPPQQTAPSAAPQSNPYHDAKYQLADAPFSGHFVQDPFSFTAPPSQTSQNSFFPPPQHTQPVYSSSYNQQPQPSFDPFFSSSSYSAPAPTPAANEAVFDPFAPSAFAPSSLNKQAAPPHSEEDDFLAVFDAAAPAAEPDISPEEKIKADLRKLREVYQLDDAAAVSSRSMDESDEDGWTPHYHGERNPTVTATNLNLPLEGRILARLSTRSLVTKDWMEAYWVISHGALFVYRNESDYRYNPANTMVKKKIPITRALVCNKVKRKEYDGIWLHNFMLQEETDFGLSNVAKFASTDRNDVDVLWLNLKTQISAVKKQSARRQPTLM